MAEINFKQIPGELKNLKQWVLWKLEEVKEGKITKVPYQINGYKANTKKSRTWNTFEKVVKEFSKGQYQGIGFVLSENDEYVGIDFDNCISEDGKINESIEDIINDCNSYAEISQSGKGIHIIIKGNLHRAIKKKEIEMYSTVRYFTITGKKISNNNNISHNQSLIDELYSKYAVTTKVTLGDIDNEGAELSDDEIKVMLDKAFQSKNGFKIEALYNGEWDNLYPSQSEADQALCNYLAFWLDKNSINIDRAFRESNLYREKWNREDYSLNTIGMAIKSCDKSYQESLIELNEKNKFNIWEEDNCYVKKLKNGTSIISNFILVPIRYIECVDNPGMSTLEVKLITDSNHCINKKYKATDFDNVQTFDKVTCDFRTKFTGNTQDLKTIKVMLFNKVEVKINAFSFGGVHCFNDKWYFLDNKGCIDSNGLESKDIILLNDNSISSSITQVNKITREELEVLSKDILNFNSKEITISIIGYISALFIKEKLKNSNVKFSHLFISGEAGAGKSETLENIIIPLLSIESSVISADGCTRFVLEKLLSSNNTIPLIIEEYKPGYIKESQIRLISSILRNSYDWHNSVRGNEKLEIDSSNLKSSIILCGESSSSETALIERSLLLTFSKKESKEDDRTKSYILLKNNRDLLRKLGRGLLEIGLSLSLDEIQQLYEECSSYISTNIKVDRIKNTGINTFMGLKILKLLYEKMNLNFEESIGLSEDNLIKSINENLIQENLDGNIYTKSIVDVTLEYINDMFKKVNCDVDTKYTKIIKDDFTGKEILGIQMRSVYMEFYKYHKDSNIPGPLLEWKDFQKQLQKSEYYISHNVAVKFDLGVDGETKVKKCFKLDIDILNAKGIDIENILEKAEVT